MDPPSFGTVPRAIQPRAYEYAAFLGKYIKACTHKVYESLDEMFGYRVVCCDYNGVERAEIIKSHFDSIKNCVVLGEDASRFDQHCHAEAIKLEHSVYKSIFKSAPEYRKFCEALSWQVDNRGSGFFEDGTIKYSVVGHRMSGDMNTSLGNKIIMILLVYEFLKKMNWDSSQVKYFNDGDDGLLFCTPKIAKTIGKLFKEFCGELGFNIVLEDPVTELERIEFCQCQPVFDGSRYVMCRSPKAVLSKDGTSLKAFKNAKEYDSHRRGISLAGLAGMGNIPVLGSYYQMMGRGAENAKLNKVVERSGLSIQSTGLDVGYVEPTIAARLSFQLAFGIVVAVQLALEAQFKSALLSFNTPRSVERLEVFQHTKILVG